MLTGRSSLKILDWLGYTRLKEKKDFVVIHCKKSVMQHFSPLRF
jgi:hypothetical protein